jgi:hypothetical protein
MLAASFPPVHIILALPCREQKGQNPPVKYRQTALLILAALCVPLALADDFKTIDGKEYKDATVSRVEPDGIVLRTKFGISKVYFVELPKEVQERFHYDPAKATQSRAAEAAKQQQPSATPATGTPSNVFTAKVADIRAEHERQIKTAIAAGEPTNRSGCLDAGTAKRAEDNAAASFDAAVKAAKNGDTATAAAYVQRAAASLRTAANAVSADAAVSQPLMRAAEAYDKAAVEYAHGDETGAALYAAAAIGFVETSTDALRKSSVPRCH